MLAEVTKIARYSRKSNIKTFLNSKGYEFDNQGGKLIGVKIRKSAIRRATDCQCARVKFRV